MKFDVNFLVILTYHIQFHNYILCNTSVNILGKYHRHFRTRKLGHVFKISYIFLIHCYYERSPTVNNYKLIFPNYTNQQIYGKTDLQDIFKYRFYYNLNGAVREVTVQIDVTYIFCTSAPSLQLAKKTASQGKLVGPDVKHRYSFALLF